jgi:hypothetical protein
MSVTSQILQRLKEIRLNAGISEKQLKEQLSGDSLMTHKQV